ncbi:sulfuric ester hydrolase [Aureococcus anophagefferens]|nr:sulfuric ester hydrolase [Aureococcus anophagefferens]
MAYQAEMGYQYDDRAFGSEARPAEKKSPWASRAATVVGGVACFALGMSATQLTSMASSIEADKQAVYSAESGDGPTDPHAAAWLAVDEAVQPWIAKETSKADASEYPHIFLSLIDDQGKADMGYGNDGLDQLAEATPFMDLLADDGIKLDKYYSQQLCTPSRSALLSGYYPIHTGMQHDVIQPESMFGMPAGHKLMPSFLKEFAGYRTHMIGKWHLGHYQSKYLPHKRGFDEFYGYLSDQLWYYNHKSPHACDGSNCYYDMQRNGAIAEDSIGVYSTFLFVDAFTDVLENEDASTPLFMYLSWQNVHAPLDPPPASFYTKTELSLVNSIEDPHRRTFASITIVLDNAMKKVVGAMKKSGFYDNSILVVASDNGGCSGSGGYNYPYRGGKQYLYEGGIHVNAFIHSPLIPKSARGTSYQGLFHVSDWLPTLVTGAMKTEPTMLPADLDGVDQWHAILGSGRGAPAAYPRTEILHNIDLWSLEIYGNVTKLRTPIQAIRVGDMKLVMGQDASTHYSPTETTCPEGIGYCMPSYESTEDCSYEYGDQKYLYNITADPSELVDLSTVHPQLVSTLEAKLAGYEATMVSPAYRNSNYDLAYSAWAGLNSNFIGPFDDPVEVALTGLVGNTAGDMNDDKAIN